MVKVISWFFRGTLLYKDNVKYIILQKCTLNKVILQKDLCILTVFFFFKNNKMPVDLAILGVIEILFFILLLLLFINHPVRYLM